MDFFNILSLEIILDFKFVTFVIHILLYKLWNQEIIDALSVTSSSLYDNLKGKMSIKGVINGCLN